MFGSIGFGELIILAGIALVVIGPERFPEFAKIVARTVRDVRGYVQEAQRDLAEELKPVKDEINKLTQVDPETYIDKLTGSTTADSEDPDAEGSMYDDEYGVYNAEPDPSAEELLGETEEVIQDAAQQAESAEGALPAEGAIPYEAFTQDEDSNQESVPVDTSDEAIQEDES